MNLNSIPSVMAAADWRYAPVPKPFRGTIVRLQGPSFHEPDQATLAGPSGYIVHLTHRGF